MFLLLLHTELLCLRLAWHPSNHPSYILQGIYRPRAGDDPKTNSNGAVHILKEVNNLEGKEDPKPSLDLSGDISHTKNSSQGDVPFSGPLEVSSSSGFAWAKRRRDGARPPRSHSRSSSRGHTINGINNVDSKRHENSSTLSLGDSRGSYESTEGTKKKQWGPLDRPDSFDASDEYHSQDLSSLYLKEHLATKKNRSHMVIIQETRIELNSWFSNFFKNFKVKGLIYIKLKIRMFFSEILEPDHTMQEVL